MTADNEKTRRVLVAEDVLSIALLIKRTLEKEGFEADTASDGRECLEKIPVYKPDLVIMDIMMPNIHGLDALRRIKADPATAGIGVIICTAKSYKQDEDQALADGAFAIIEKPFKPNELTAKTRDFFRWKEGGVQGNAANPIPMKAARDNPYLPPLDVSRASVRLLGTRGSMPVSGGRYARYGGNTSCVSIERGRDAVIIDAGTGIRDLGKEIIKKGPSKIHLFISHTHWDHIQGFPFFAPAYVPGYEIVVYGASGLGKDLESLFRGQLDKDYFPVQMEDMRANFEFIRLVDNPVVVGDMKIYWEFTHHPGATLGYKIETGAKSICYVSDNEFLKGYVGHPLAAESDEEMKMPYMKIMDFVRDADMLIAEAQYTNEEYKTKIGWGHSSISNACVLAKLGRIRDWIVIHHDPQHDDAFLEEKLSLIKRVSRDIGYEGCIRSGFDGMVEYLD